MPGGATLDKPQDQSDKQSLNNSGASQKPTNEEIYGQKKDDGPGAFDHIGDNFKMDDGFLNEGEEEEQGGGNQQRNKKEKEDSKAGGKDDGDDGYVDDPATAGAGASTAGAAGNAANGTDHLGSSSTAGESGNPSTGGNMPTTDSKYGENGANNGGYHSDPTGDTGLNNSGYNNSSNSPAGYNGGGNDSTGLNNNNYGNTGANSTSGNAATGSSATNGASGNAAGDGAKKPDVGDVETPDAGDMAKKPGTAKAAGAAALSAGVGALQDGEGLGEAGKEAAKAAATEVAKKKVAEIAAKKVAEEVAKKAALAATLEAAGDALAVETAGISKAIQWAIQALDLANTWLKDHGVDLAGAGKAMMRNMTMILCGLIMLLTIGGSAMMMLPAFGAINGSNGRSDQVTVAKDDPANSKIVDASNELAVLGDSLGGAIGGLGGETPGTLSSRSGSPILGYKRLRFTKRDLQFLNNIKTKGVDSVKGSRLDARVLFSLIYLANRHSSLMVGNIVSVYEDMPIDKENSADPQILKNISAHVTGQAADLTEIDFVFKGVDMASSCSKTPEDPTRDIVWFNDQKKELYRQKCLGNVAQGFAGGPIINNVMTTAIPIKIIWQDEAPKISGNNKATNRGGAERSVEQNLGLPPGALDKTNGLGVEQQIGFAELAQQLGLPSEIVGASNKEDFFKKLGSGYLEKQFGLSSNSLVGNNPTEIASSLANRSAEEMFNLPMGSWNSGNLVDSTISVGRTTIEKEFGLAQGSLNDPISAKAAIAQAGIRPDDITKVSRATGMDEATVSSFINSAGQGTLNNDALGSLGSRKLEQSWGMQTGSLTPYVEIAKQKIADPASAAKSATNLADGIVWDQVNTNLPSGEINQETVKNMINKLGNGDNVKDDMLQMGASRMDGFFGLGSGTSYGCISAKNCNIASQTDLLTNTQLKNTVESIFDGNFNSYSSQIGLDTLRQGLSNGPQNLSVALDQATKDLLESNPLEAAKQIGLDVLDKNTGCGSCTMDSLLSKKDDLMKQIDQSLGFDEGTMADLLSGKSVPGSLSSLGSNSGAGGLSGSGTGGTSLSNLADNDPMIMQKVYRPEARRKVHQVIDELIEMPNVLKNLNYKVIQMITFSEDRDVVPFESKIEKIYGKSIADGGSRVKNYGLFSMPQAHRNIHIGY